MIDIYNKQTGLSMPRITFSKINEQLEYILSPYTFQIYDVSVGPQYISFCTNNIAPFVQWSKMCFNLDHEIKFVKCNAEIIINNIHHNFINLYPRSIITSYGSVTRVELAYDCRLIRLANANTFDNKISKINDTVKAENDKIELDKEILQIMAELEKELNLPTLEEWQEKFDKLKASCLDNDNLDI